MGRGLADPVDDIRSTNPPSNEPLMNALVEDFVKSGYDIKHLCESFSHRLPISARGERIPPM